MPEPLKYMYNEAFFDAFNREMFKVYNDFDRLGFTSAIFCKAWKDFELKDRMRHIASTLNDFLPKSYPAQIEMLVALIKNLKNDRTTMIFEYMFVPDFVEQFGLDDYETSIYAMEEITQLASCEFAIRPFIVKYPKTMDQLMEWADHENYRVRRLASEGCRPRLPWAMALPEFKKDPSRILPILEKLKSDPSDFVFRSVANNLNDISKDNPEITLNLSEQWIGQSKNTDWVVRHACRGLLKEGNERALRLFGYSPAVDVELNLFEIVRNHIPAGGDLHFRFGIQNNGTETKKIRLEYNVYFMKSNGKRAAKIFKISEVFLDPGKSIGYAKRHSFRAITTRKYYPGLHQITIVVNGIEQEKVLDFVLGA